MAPSHQHQHYDQNYHPARHWVPEGGDLNPDLQRNYDSFTGQRQINARIRPENTHLMGGGLDAFNMVNSPYGKQRGIGFKQAEQAVAEARPWMSDQHASVFTSPYGAARSPLSGPGFDVTPTAPAAMPATTAQPAGMLVPGSSPGSSIWRTGEQLGAMVNPYKTGVNISSSYGTGSSKFGPVKMTAPDEGDESDKPDGEEEEETA